MPTRQSLKQTLKTAVTASLATASLAAAFMAAPAFSQTGRTASKGTILVVLSSEHTLTLKNGAKHETGYYLNELAVPAKRLIEAGYTLRFANPKGNEPRLDAGSDSVDFFHGDKAAYQASKDFLASLRGLKQPATLSEVVNQGLDAYAGVFIPGGHAPTIDLMTNSDLGIILRSFHHAAKPTGLICHGPLSLAAAVVLPDAYKQALIAGQQTDAKQAGAGWPYQGYKMTTFSAAEERQARANLGGDLAFDVENALRLAGADLQEGAAWQSKVVQDRELITGQNPFSDDAFATALVAALNASTAAK